MKKEQCENLHKEYLTLKEKMDEAFQWNEVIPGKPIITNTAPPFDEIDRYDELKKIIPKECKECLELTPSEWFEMKDN